MANRKHLKILKQGAVAWNEWRESNREIRPDLSGANLSRVDLTGADLGHANLSRASLKEANLYGAILSFADLSMADLGRANLRITKLSEADLREANLYEANLNYAELFGADLTMACMALTNVAGVDLSTVKGLKTIKHFGRSTISIDTIYSSKGRIPIEFLRGAGVPENFIEYMSSLVGTAFEFYSCFISYSGKDRSSPIAYLPTFSGRASVAGLLRITFRLGKNSMSRSTSQSECMKNSCLSCHPPASTASG